MPDWMLAEIESRKSSSRAFVMPLGKRNGYLFKLGCKCRGAGASYEELSSLLTVARSTHCEAGADPISDAELRSIIAQCMKYAPDNEEEAYIN